MLKRLVGHLWMLSIFALLSSWNGDGDGDGSEGGDGKDDDGASPQGGKPDDGNEPRFTQADLNRLDKKARTQAGKAARAAVLEELGVDNLDDAKAVIAAKAAQDEADKTAVQKAEEARQAAEAQAAEAVERARTAQLESAIVRALGRVSEDTPAVRADSQDGALSLAMLAAADIEGDDIAEVAAEAVAAVRESTPALFATSSDEDQSSNGGGPPPPPRRPASEGRRRDRGPDLQARYEAAVASRKTAGFPSDS